MNLSYVNYNKKTIELDYIELVKLVKSVSIIDNEYLRYIHNKYTLFLDNPQYYNQSIVNQVLNNIFPEIIICYRENKIQYIIAKNVELLEYYNLDGFHVNHINNFLKIEKTIAESFSL